jgi:DNA-binding transcriptional LysR family regulator
VTPAQLRSFAAVARLGSVKAGAHALAVSDAAISLAIGALRRDLGDDLYVRCRRRIELTPGGRRLATMAAEMLEPRAARRPARRHRPRSRPSGEAGVSVEAVPFLRYRLIVVTAPWHTMSGLREIAPVALTRARLARRTRRRRRLGVDAAVPRAVRHRPAGRARLPQHRGCAVGGGRRRGHHAGARPRREQRAPPPLAGAAGRQGNAARRPLVREHARQRPLPAGRAGTAALRDVARGHAGDVHEHGRARGSSATPGLRDPVELGPASGRTPLPDGLRFAGRGRRLPAPLPEPGEGAPGP